MRARKTRGHPSLICLGKEGRFSRRTNNLDQQYPAKENTMGFYFVCYFLIGICFGTAGTIHLARRDERRTSVSMFWLTPPVWGEFIILAGAMSPFIALLTSLIQGGFWVFLTLIELALGAIVARSLIPLSAMNGLLFLTPAVLGVIFGALWGFWYI